MPIVVSHRHQMPGVPAHRAAATAKTTGYAHFRLWLLTPLRAMQKLFHHSPAPVRLRSVTTLTDNNTPAPDFTVLAQELAIFMENAGTDTHYHEQIIHLAQLTLAARSVYTPGHIKQASEVSMQQDQEQLDKLHQQHSDLKAEYGAEYPGIVDDPHYPVSDLIQAINDRTINIREQHIRLEREQDKIEQQNMQMGITLRQLASQLSSGDQNDADETTPQPAEQQLQQLLRQIIAPLPEAPGASTYSRMESRWKTEEQARVEQWAQRDIQLEQNEQQRHKVFRQRVAPQAEAFAEEERQREEGLAIIRAMGHINELIMSNNLTKIEQQVVNEELKRRMAATHIPPWLELDPSGRRPRIRL
jgi:hypothetical protein